MVKNKLKFFIGAVLILILKVVNIFSLVRISNCHTDRIGHFCGNIDNYLSSRSNGEIAIFIKSHTVSNNEVLRRWSLVRGLYFINKNFMWIHGAIYYFDQNSKYLISWENELSPKFHLNAISPKNFILSENEIKNYEISNDNTKDRKIICLHNRDEAYIRHSLQNTPLEDSNFHEFRNFPFEDFEYAIKKLSKINYTFVRIGKIVEKEFFGNCIDKTGKNSTDYDDLMLIAKSQFIVGCNSGVETISRILRKPQVLVNYIPFNPNEMIPWGPNSTMIFKHIFDSNKNRYLSLKEMFLLNNKFDIHYKGDFFTDNGLIVENNSQEEIYDAIYEHILRMSDEWSESDEQNKLQNELRETLSFNNEFNLIFDKLKIKVGSKFLEKNIHLSK